MQNRFFFEIFVHDKQKVYAQELVQFSLKHHPVSNIWDAKKKRQLIFTSHNANLVVNGDAELVICCDYKESGSQTRGTIVTEGSIDSSEVKDQISSIMEGGEKAFRLRKDKYGF